MEWKKRDEKKIGRVEGRDRKGEEGLVYSVRLGPRKT